MIPELTMALFEGYMGETFHVRSEEGRVALKLARVMETPTRHRDDPRGTTRTEGFCVYFEGSADAGLAQGIHTLTHDGMGEVELFMTPVASPKPEICRYEVVINRLIEA